MNDLEEKIRLRLPGKTMISLATVTEDGKPWVRYVMATMGEDLVVRTCTSISSRKVTHIRANSEVHITCGSTGPGGKEPYLQIQARAEATQDQAERDAYWDDHLKMFFPEGSMDSKYCVIVMQPYRIEYQPMGPDTTEIWEQLTPQ